MYDSTIKTHIGSRKEEEKAGQSPSAPFSPWKVCNGDERTKEKSKHDISFILQVFLMSSHNRPKKHATENSIFLPTQKRRTCYIYTYSGTHITICQHSNFLAMFALNMRSRWLKLVTHTWSQIGHQSCVYVQHTVCVRMICRSFVKSFLHHSYGIQYVHRFLRSCGHPVVPCR